MNLNPTEKERLTIFTAAQLAREHRRRGIKLSHPEAAALICDELLMCAREGRSLKDLMGYGAEILTSDDVLPGVPELIPVIHVEAMFPDGTKLITVHQPIRPGKAETAPGPRAGEIITPDEEIELNAGRRTGSVTVTNTGDRPVQIGSHFHFFEVNRALDFDRQADLRLAPRHPVGHRRPLRARPAEGGGAGRVRRPRPDQRLQQPHRGHDRFARSEGTGDRPREGGRIPGSVGRW